MARTLEITDTQGREASLVIDTDKRTWSLSGKLNDKAKLSSTGGSLLLGGVSTPYLVDDSGEPVKVKLADGSAYRFRIVCNLMGESDTPSEAQVKAKLARKLERQRAQVAATAAALAAK